MPPFEYSGVGDEGLALKYARLCLDRGLPLRGPHQPFIKNMRELINSPEAHWSWRFRVQGKKRRLRFVGLCSRLNQYGTGDCELQSRYW